MKYSEMYDYHLINGSKMRRANWAKGTYIQVDISLDVGDVVIYFVNSSVSNAWQWKPNRSNHITDDLTTDNWEFYDEL